MAVTREAILRAQRLVGEYVEPGRLLSEELITDRRLEVLGEEDRASECLVAADQLNEQGFAICEGTLSAELVTRLLNALGRADQVSTLRRSGGILAVRNLLEACPEVESLAYSRLIRQYVDAVLKMNALPVRGILFDKVPGANWKVPWHQDVTIAVKERIEMNGFGPWSVKAEVQHVQPPAHVLQGMVSVRIHLDDCGADNGALRVIPGSHRYGKLNQEQVNTMVKGAEPIICAVRAGGILLMRPLLLHASSASMKPGHRRVIHLDFACGRLPGELRWALELSSESGG